MKFKKCKYLVAFYDGPKEVEGYAVLTDLTVRFAVRELWSGSWQADHWDTGFSLGRDWAATRHKAASNCVALLRQKIESGESQKALDAAVGRSSISYRHPA